MPARGLDWLDSVSLLRPQTLVYLFIYEYLIGSRDETSRFHGCPQDHIQTT